MASEEEDSDETLTRLELLACAVLFLLLLLGGYCSSHAT